MSDTNDCFPGGVTPECRSSDTCGWTEGTGEQGVGCDACSLLLVCILLDIRDQISKATEKYDVVFGKLWVQFSRKTQCASYESPYILNTIVIVDTGYVHYVVRFVVHKGEEFVLHYVQEGLQW